MRCTLWSRLCVSCCLFRSQLAWLQSRLYLRNCRVVRSFGQSCLATMITALNPVYFGWFRHSWYQSEQLALPEITTSPFQKQIIKFDFKTTKFSKSVVFLRKGLVRKALGKLWVYYKVAYIVWLTSSTYIQHLSSVFTFCTDIVAAEVCLLSQLRESDLPVGDASRTLGSSSGLLELLPIYQPLVDYIGSNGSKLEFYSPSKMVLSQYAVSMAYV